MPTITGFIVLLIILGAAWAMFSRQGSAAATPAPTRAAFVPPIATVSPSPTASPSATPFHSPTPSPKPTLSPARLKSSDAVATLSTTVGGTYEFNVTLKNVGEKPSPVKLSVSGPSGTGLFLYCTPACADSGEILTVRILEFDPLPAGKERTYKIVYQAVNYGRVDWYVSLNEGEHAWTGSTLVVL